MTANFPASRPRRLRRTQGLRDLAADVTLTPSNLVLPLFVSDANEPRDVPSMPGVQQFPVSDAVRHIQALTDRGLRAFMLFGVTDEVHKDVTGSYATSPEAPVNRVQRDVRQAGSDAVLMADLCFCEYTEHGHCGVLEAASTGGIVDNDATLENLGQTAVAQTRAGADVVAPSGMMDGQVHAIRTALDAANHQQTAILSYSVKYASHFYGPFRDAGGGRMQFGDRRGYQMDFRRSYEWRRELEQDLAEGADMVMVKPALAYLDVIAQVRQACDVPVAAYHVSGEYAMLHAAAQRGWLDLKQAALEATYAIRRAGADLIVTYFAEQLLEWQQA